MSEAGAMSVNRNNSMDHESNYNSKGIALSRNLSKNPENHNEISNNDMGRFPMPGGDMDSPVNDAGRHRQTYHMEALFPPEFFQNSYLLILE